MALIDLLRNDVVRESIELQTHSEGPTAGISSDRLHRLCVISRTMKHNFGYKVIVFRCCE